MKTAVHSPGVWRIAAIGCFQIALLGLLAPLGAHEVLAVTSDNRRWHAPAESITVTFLGNDQKETAILNMKKAAVMDTEVVIRSDATSIALVSGNGSRIRFAVDADSQNASHRLKFGGGSDPSLLFDDKEYPNFKREWAEAVNSNEPNLTLELQDATKAVVKFDPKAIEQGRAIDPAAPAESPSAEPAKSAGKAEGSSRAHEMLRTAGSTSPAQLKAAAAAFANAVKHRCTKCLGKGKITVSVQYDTRQEGKFIKKLYHDETQTCNVCKGSGHLRASDALLKTSAGNFVRVMATMNRDDPDSQEALNVAYKMINDVMIGDHRTWVLLTESGKSILAQASLANGTPVIVRVTVNRELPQIDGKRQFLVTVGGLDRQVQISDPVSADDIQQGAALVGGLVSEGRAGAPTTVLSNGFLVAPTIDPGWWWWYGAQPQRP